MTNMKKILLAVVGAAFIVTSATVNFAEAAVSRYTAEDTFYYGEDITPAMAKERARSRAYRNALEQAGVYVRSYTKVNNLAFAEDEIETITAGLLKVVGQPQYTPGFEGGGYTMKAVIIAEIDDSQIANWQYFDQRRI